MVKRRKLIQVVILSSIWCIAHAAQRPSDDDSFLSYYLQASSHDAATQAATTQPALPVSAPSAPRKTKNAIVDDAVQAVLQGMQTRADTQAIVQATATADAADESEQAAEAVVVKPPQGDDDFDREEIYGEGFDEAPDAMQESGSCRPCKKVKKPCQERIKKISLGPPYSYVILDRKHEKHWLIPLNFSCSYADSALDSCRQKITLSEFIFGNADANSTIDATPAKATIVNFHVRDIFLLSRLSENGILQLQYDTDLPPFQFGNTRDEQYLRYLAPVAVSIAANQEEEDTGFGLFYRMRVANCQRIALTFGAQIQVKSIKHTMDLRLIGDTLFRFGYTQNVGVREEVITRFHADFADVPTFFELAVLKPKGLVFSPFQRKTGFGDLTMAFIADFADYFQNLDGLQLGINFFFPTGKKPKGVEIWEISLGNNAFGAELFGSVILNSGNNWFNPAAYITGSVFAPFSSSTLRVQRRVMNTINDNPVFNTATNASNIPGLIVPVFTQYLADPFDEIDSTIPMFADSLTSGKVKRGSNFLFGLGNYFYNVFHACFRLGIFYDFALKKGDETCMCPINSAFVTNNSTCLPQEEIQRLSWNLTYRFDAACLGDNALELSIGSQHVISGKNTIRTNEFIASLVAVF